METFLGIPNGVLLLLMIASGIFGYVLHRPPYQPPVITFHQPQENRFHRSGFLTTLSLCLFTLLLLFAFQFGQ